VIRLVEFCRVGQRIGYKTKEAPAPAKKSDAKKLDYEWDGELSFFAKAAAPVKKFDAPDETLLHIGDGGDLTSHDVCRLIEDRGIDGDSISRGVGGLVDNRGVSVD
jgi:hypothetical protein